MFYIPTIYTDSSRAYRILPYVHNYLFVPFSTLQAPHHYFLVFKYFVYRFGTDQSFKLPAWHYVLISSHFSNKYCCESVALLANLRLSRVVSTLSRPNLCCGSAPQLHTNTTILMLPINLLWPIISMVLVSTLHIFDM